MSWQAYVDSSLVGSGHIDEAAIISAAGDSVWATTADFTGRTGVCIVKTKQSILCSHYPEHVQAGNATQTVEALADYLVNLGY